MARIFIDTGPNTADFVAMVPVKPGKLSIKAVAPGGNGGASLAAGQGGGGGGAGEYVEINVYCLAFAPIHIIQNSVTTEPDSACRLVISWLDAGMADSGNLSYSGEIRLTGGLPGLSSGIGGRSGASLQGGTSSNVNAYANCPEGILGSDGKAYSTGGFAGCNTTAPVANFKKSEFATIPVISATGAALSWSLAPLKYPNSHAWVSGIGGQGGCSALGSGQTVTYTNQFSFNYAAWGAGGSGGTFGVDIGGGGPSLGGFGGNGCVIIEWDD